MLIIKYKSNFADFFYTLQKNRKNINFTNFTKKCKKLDKLDSLIENQIVSFKKKDLKKEVNWTNWT